MNKESHLTCFSLVSILEDIILFCSLDDLVSESIAEWFMFVLYLVFELAPNRVLFILCRQQASQEVTDMWR